MSDFYNFNNPDGMGMTSMRTRQRLVDVLKKSGIYNKDVLNAMTIVPRHLFIDEAMASRAYEDIPLPIGFNQTISQPYVVAKMTEAALGNKHRLHKVLEIGTGSGYQAAVLSKLADEVYTIERIQDLYKQARERFNKLRLRNITTMYGDGNLGWQDHAPYDAIIVTCAAEKIPDELLEQLANGGKLVIPVELSTERDLELNTQQLEIITKNISDGSISYNTTYLELVRFVPMLSGKE